MARKGIPQSAGEWNEIGREYLPGTLGIEIVSMEPDALRARMRVEKRLCASNGYLHAGAVVSFAYTCCGYATVTGVNSGTVDIIARAVSFDKAQSADLSLRVANPLEIDSIRPRDVHYGELLTVYGVGVDSLFIAQLGDIGLIKYPFSNVRDSAGVGQVKYWVPPPAHSGQLFFLGSGVFGLDTAITTVEKEDIFEPNDTIPSDINLDLGGPWPGTILAPILFTNPALAFEPVDRTLGLGEDWFHFHTTDSTQALTRPAW